jgi:hypothetical protein
VKKTLAAAGIAILAAAVLAHPAAWILDRAAGTDVLLVTAVDPAAVEANRVLWEMDGSPKGEVPGLYGTPSKAPIRLVAPAEGSLLRPKEDPDRLLYLLRDGDHPLQVQTLWYFALLGTIAGIPAGAALLWLGRRKGRPPTPAGA